MLQRLVQTAINLDISAVMLLNLIKQEMTNMLVKLYL